MSKVLTQPAADTVALPGAMRKPQAVAYCGLTDRTFERLVSGGKITPRRISGRVVVYLRRDLDSFLESLPAAKGDRPACDTG